MTDCCAEEVVDVCEEEVAVDRSSDDVASVCEEVVVVDGAADEAAATACATEDSAELEYVEDAAADADVCESVADADEDTVAALLTWPCTN